MLKNVETIHKSLRGEGYWCRRGRIAALSAVVLSSLSIVYVYAHRLRNEVA
jgi:hypothetical protein